MLEDDFQAQPTQDDSGGFSGLAVMASFWAKKWLILGTGVVLAILGYVFAMVQTPLYEASASVIFPRDSMPSILSSALGLGGTGAGGGGDRTAGLPALGVTPSRQPSIDYADNILNSRMCLDQICKDLDLPKVWGVTPFEARNRLSDRGKAQKVLRDNKIVVTFRDPDPELAVKVVQAYIHVYDFYTNQHSLTGTRRQRVFVQEQLKNSDVELKSVQDELARYQAKYGHEILESEPESATTTLLNLQQRQYEALSKAAETDGFLTELRAKTVQQAATLAQDSNASAPQDPEVEELQRQLLTAQVTLSNLQLSRTDEHPDVVAAKKQVDAIKAMMRRKAESLTSSYSEGLTNELREALAQDAASKARLETANRLLAEFESRYATQPSTTMDYKILVRRFELAEAVNRMLLLELQRCAIAEQLDSIELEVLDKPEANPIPVYPRKMLTAAVSGMFGVLLMLVLVAATTKRQV